MQSSAYFGLKQNQTIRIFSFENALSVRAAIDDLARDLKRVLNAQVVSDRDADTANILVCIDTSLEVETFTISVAEQLKITAGDNLGAVYGIYEFTHRYLGIDPLWFWKDQEFQSLEFLKIDPVCFHSGAPRFRYRGWFINDEDLISRWKESGHCRFLKWPKRQEMTGLPTDDKDINYEGRLLEYYTPIIDLQVMQMVFEALLRLRGNLIIPASFIDIMNPPEADIIRAAVNRGLYVSQHHVEPVGVSHFSYETWWAEYNRNADANDKVPSFSYREAPKQMEQCWRAYVKKWNEVAGENIIWQVGLRGRGDRPLWGHDPEAKARAGEFISDALAKQMDIIREFDVRTDPPATLTLWFEGCELIRSGLLTPPEEIAYVFADDPHRQEMQKDFWNLPRSSDRKSGAYYHVAVWPWGPHLAQSPQPDKVARIVSELDQKGDTFYAILNVSNVREHLMGLTVWNQQLWAPDAWRGRNYFLKKWASEEWAVLFESYLDAIVETDSGFRFHDGGTRTFIERIIACEEIGTSLLQLHKPDQLGEDVESVSRNRLCLSLLSKGAGQLRATLQAASMQLENLIHQIETLNFEVRGKRFIQVNLKVQATIMAHLYRCLAAMLEGPPDWKIAGAELRLVDDAFAEGEVGKWKNWYRGETKMGLRRLACRIQYLAERSSTK